MLEAHNHVRAEHCGAVEVAADRCPCCEYPLHSSEVTVVCPECGLEFDRTGEVFVGVHPLKPGPIAKALTGAVCICSAVAIVSAMYIFWDDRMLATGAAMLRSFWPIFVPLVAMYAFLMIIEWRRKTGVRRKVIVGPNGITLVRRGRYRHRFRWDEVKDVTHHEAYRRLGTDAILIIARDGRVMKIPKALVGLRDDFSDCLAAIRTQRALHGADVRRVPTRSAQDEQREAG